MEIEKEKIAEDGFCVMHDIYDAVEVSQIIQEVNSAAADNLNFRRSADLFAIRRFLHEVPSVRKLVFSEKLKAVVHQIFGIHFFVTKSIYFDKPEQSNWFVAYHQDMTISVQERIETDGFTNWTIKQGQFAVQPPLSFLENIFTIRIHLDDTDADNGALKTIPGSHRKGIYRPESIDWNIEKENVCPVKKGGIMIMRPLLLHASNRTTGNKQRRVIHVEFSNQELPGKLEWSERLEI